MVSQGSNEDSAKLDFEREYCKTDLYYLGKYILGYDKAVFHLHRFMAGSMEDLPDGYRGLREFPRDSFKSTFLVITYAVQQLLINPNIRILLKSNVGKNASNKLIEIKNHFIKGPMLIALFPEYKPKRISDQGSGSTFKTAAYTAPQEEGNLTAAGVGASQTSQHYDIIIGDDYWDQKSVKSPEVMTKCKDEMGELEYLLASPATGKICFIGTRFSYDDPSMDLIENEEYECVIASGITPAGRTIFPESLTLKKFYNQAKSKLYIFSCQIMLNPSRDDAGFKNEWFKYSLKWTDMKTAEMEGRITTRRVLLTDAAGDNKQSSDYVALIVVAIDNLGRKVVIDYVREKLQPNGFINRVFQLADKYSVEFVVRQKAPLETSLMSFVADKNQERLDAGMRSVSFYDYSLGKQSKMARMEALQPYFQTGQIYFDPDVDTIPELEKEILSFPFDMSNDDGMDALSELTDRVVARKPQHIELIPEGPRHYTPTEIEVKGQSSLYRAKCCSDVMIPILKNRAKAKARRE